jgi:outer membrane immunogenic protein
MNKFSLAVLAVFAASPAVAADIAEPTPEPVVEEVAAWDWTGKYIGVHKGASWVNADFSVPGFDESEEFNGFILGGFAGYNYMWDNFLIGVEGDISYNWNDKNFNVGGVRGDAGTDWQGSLRARLGYAFDRVLVYKTFGWTATNAFVEPRGGNNEDRTFHGWTLGVGADYAATDNIFLRGEYRYSNFDNKNIGGVKVDLDQHQVLFGVAYKF